jgi:glycosyltransferase involved in cell wall biosynthesis
MRKDRPSAATGALPTLLVLTSTYPRWPGDPEPGFVHELAKRLTDRFRVLVLGPHAPGARTSETLDGVEIVRYRYAPEKWETLVNDGGIVANLQRSRWKALLVPSFLGMQLWSAWRLLRGRRVDVIHAHWLVPQGLVAAILQYLPGCKVPFVATSHGADLYALKGRALGGLKRHVVAKASAVTVVSEAMRSSVLRMGADPADVHLRPMGVDLETRFIPDPDTKRSQSELLFVGRLVEKKGLRHLLDAMPRVLARYPAATLTIAGFGPERQALEEQALRLGLASHIRFLGAVPQKELPTLYRGAVVFVAPFVEASSGDQEGLGLVLVEAIGCGCPVIAGDVPAVRDVLGTRSGNRIDPTKTDRLADAIIAVMDDPQAALGEAERLRATLAGRLDWRKVADGYAQTLLAVAGCGALEKARAR